MRLYDIKAESSFIGACLVEPSIIPDAITLLDTDMFYDKGLSIVFTAIEQLYNNNAQIDLVTVEAKAKEIGAKISPSKISSCIDLVPTAIHYKEYSKIVNEKYRLRQLVTLATDIRELANTENSSEILTRSEKRITELSSVTAKVKTMKDTCRNLVHTLQENKQLQKTLTGFKDYDSLLNGYRKGEMHIIAGRPASGKSSWVANILENISKDQPDKTALFFSLEMSDEELLSRFISHTKRIPYGDLRDGKFDKGTTSQFVAGLEKYSNGNIQIIDDASVNMQDIKRYCIQYKANGGLSVVVIDYLQLMGGTNKRHDRYQMITEMSREIKLLAKTLGVPIVALSQMSRKIEDRQQADPRLSDLRESGSIEQDADSVTFIVPRKEEKGVKDIEMYLLKNRHGRTGIVNFEFDGSMMTFRESANQPKRD